MADNVTSHNLRVGSFNSHGMGVGRIEYINELFSTVDILCVQEHWLFNDQIISFGNKIINAYIFGVSGMDESTLLTGRPFGGCAILWKSR